MSQRSVLLTVAVALVTAGCADGEDAAIYAPADTTVVRIEAGSVWGGPATLVEEMRVQADLEEPEFAFQSVYAFTVGPDGDLFLVDGLGKGVLRYDVDGRLAAEIWGFFGGPNGVEMLPDERLVVRDEPTAQLRVFTARGDHLGDWPLPPSASELPPAPLFKDVEDRLFIRVLVDSEGSAGERRAAYVRLSPAGEILDTIPDPFIDFYPLTLTVNEPDGSQTRLLVPFTPLAHWTRTLLGDVVTGISHEYILDVVRPDGSVTRIEKADAQPVPTQENERWAHYHRVDRRARQIDYKWTWGGPVIPETKPYFKRIFSDRDGRIWVQLHQPADLVESQASGEESESQTRTALSRSRERWIEAVVFDVFEPDGRYLGQVSAPAGFRMSPPPVIAGDRVWAVVHEEDGSLAVVRYRMEH